MCVCEGDPAAPITPSQIGIPLLIWKKKSCLSSALRQQLCCRVPTSALQCCKQAKYMQSDGTAEYGMGTREGRAAQQQPSCRLQFAGAWNLDPMGIAILHMNWMDQWGTEK